MSLYLFKQNKNPRFSCKNEIRASTETPNEWKRRRFHYARIKCKIVNKTNRKAKHKSCEMS